jgi:hypothetical protein
MGQINKTILSMVPVPTTSSAQISCSKRRFGATLHESAGKGFDVTVPSLAAAVGKAYRIAAEVSEVIRNIGARAAA